MEKFEGYKFRSIEGEFIITHDSYTNEVIKKQKIVATRSYLKWLDAKYLEELKIEVKRLKIRLENEAKEYGECDKVELERYLSLLKQIDKLSQPIEYQRKTINSGKLQPMKYPQAPQPYLPKASR